MSGFLQTHYMGTERSSIPDSTIHYYLAYIKLQVSLLRGALQHEYNILEWHCKNTSALLWVMRKVYLHVRLKLEASVSVWCYGGFCQYTLQCSCFCTPTSIWGKDAFCFIYESLKLGQMSRGSSTCGWQFLSPTLIVTFQTSVTDSVFLSVS